jgi:hypothetical protein
VRFSVEGCEGELEVGVVYFVTNSRFVRSAYMFLGQVRFGFD